ncbi:hypothetical protein SALBM311S_00556 [Streptomyces alboniger]
MEGGCVTPRVNPATPVARSAREGIPTEPRSFPPSPGLPAMLRRRTPVVTGPELDDRQLHRTLTELRPSQQMHGLGTGATRPLWTPAAELLRATGRDWDRRVHRIFVLAHTLPPVVTDRWVKDCSRGPRRPGRAGLRTGRPGEGEDRLVERMGCVRRLPASRQRPSRRTPPRWVAVLRLMYSCRSPPHQPSLVWTEAVNRDPWNRTAYHQMLRHLSPRGHGTLMQMIDFAERCTSQAPYGSPVALLPLAARVELVAYRQRPTTPPAPSQPTDTGTNPRRPSRRTPR